MLSYNLDEESVDCHLEKIIPFAIRSKSISVYKSIQKKLNNTKNCYFSCRIIEQCTESHSDLKKVIVKSLTSNLENKDDIFEYFTLLSESTAKYTFENLKELRETFNKQIFTILKYIYCKKEEFEYLKKNNFLFGFALKSFLEKKMKFLRLELFYSFLDIEQTENKIKYLNFFYTLDEDYFIFAMEKWNTLQKKTKCVNTIKLYFLVLFGIFQEKEMILKLVISTLKNIELTFSLNEICDVYDFIKNETYSQKLVNNIDHQSKCFVNNLQVKIDPNSWENYLQIQPNTEFCENVIRKILSIYDFALFYSKIIRTELYQKMLLNIKNLTTKEQSILHKFRKICEDASLKKTNFVPIIDYLDSPTQIFFLSKLSFNRKLYKIFAIIVKESSTNQKLLKCVDGSRFGKVIHQFVQKILLKNLTIEDFFLLKHLNLIGVLRAFLFPMNNLSKTKSEDMLKEENWFDKSVDFLQTKYHQKQALEKILCLIKNNRYCKMLFDQGQLDPEKVLSDKNWLTDSWAELEELTGKTKAAFDRLSVFDCWLKRKIYYLVCFKLDFFRVLDKTEDLSEEETRKLYIYCTGKTDEKSYSKFFEDISDKPKKTLTFSELGDIIEHVNDIYKYLQNNYFCFNIKKITPIKYNVKDLNIFSNVNLFDYLLYSAEKNYQETSTRKENSIKKESIITFKQTLEKIQLLRNMSPQLAKLPEVFQKNYGPKFKSKITNFVTKFDPQKISFNKVFSLFKELHPSLQSLGQAKAQLIKQVCTYPEIESKLIISLI